MVKNPMLENLTGFYKQADGQTKRKILGCIFSEKLVFEKGRVATTTFTEPIQALFKIAKVLQEGKNKKEVKINLLSTLAPQASRILGRTGDPRINPEASGLV